MIRSLSVASVFVLACACSDADLTGDEGSPSGGDANDQAFESSADAPSSSSSEEILNELRFQDLEISFLWLGPGSVDSQEGSVAIAESFSTDYVGALREQYGALTSLELFNAFAPDGAEPHTILVARHEGEARAHGRTGAGLAPRDIDGRTSSIDKSIPANCQSQILPNIAPGSYTEIQSADAGVDGRFVFLCAGAPKVSGVKDSLTAALGCELHLPAKELTVGLCNDSQSVNSTEFYSSTFSVINGQIATFRGNVAKNTAQRFTMPPDGSTFAQRRSLAVVGRNNASNVINFHVQKTGVGVYP